MGVSDRAQDTDWLELCRRATDALRGILADAPSTAERVREVGTRGEGGDRTLVIDAAAEEAVFARARARCTTRACASRRSARSAGPSTSAIPTRWW